MTLLSQDYHLKDLLRELLEPYDGILTLECDGFTRVASYVLTKREVEHEVWGGFVQQSDGKGEITTIQPHFWIKAGPWTVDFRLRMWLGAQAPHGVFQPGRHLDYQGDLMNGFSCDDLTFQILTGMEAL